MRIRYRTTFLRLRFAWPCLPRWRAWAAVFLLTLAGPLRAAAETSKLHPEFGVGAWIWGPTTAEKQTCRFWRQVTIPLQPAVVDARFRITADNAFRFYLDGRELGRGAEWKSLTEFNLTRLLTPGTHVMAVEGFNEYLEAGMVAGLRVQFADGTSLAIGTDATWKIVPEYTKDWYEARMPRPEWGPARVVAPYLLANWKSKPARIVQQPPIEVRALRLWQSPWFQVPLLVVCAGALFFSIHLWTRLALQSATQEILQRERARIARDIHDDFGARLTKLVLFGELAQREVGGGSPARPRFDQICDEGRRLLRAVDEVIWAVNSRRDTLRDFETYVCSYAEGFLATKGIRCRIEADAEVPEAAFDLAIRRNLFLAVKEALNNVARHSEATEVRLGIHLQHEWVTVTISDNGCGFDINARPSERNGLLNMQQRTAEIGGSCRIVTEPGKGCLVEFSAPLQHVPNRFQLWRGWWRRRLERRRRLAPRT